MSDQGISVGDAVLTFLGDTTRLDQAFEKVNTEAAAKLGPADAQVQKIGQSLNQAGNEALGAGAKAEVMGEEMSVAAQETTVNMREAKGEIALLGEEIGIRVPRHLRSFVAELPGVGVALESAFSATAVLILIQLLVEGAEKISDFLAKTLYAEEANKEMMKSVADLNGELVSLWKMYEEAKKKADEYGKSALELARIHREETQKSVEELTKQLGEEEEQVKRLQKAEQDHIQSRFALGEAYRLYSAGVLTAWEALKMSLGADVMAEKNAKQLGETQNKLVKTNAELALAKQNLRNATHEETKAQQDATKTYAEAQKRLDETLRQLEKAEDQFKKLGKAAASDFAPSLPPAVERLRELGAAIRATDAGTSDMQLKLSQQAKAMEIVTRAWREGHLSVETYNRSLLTLKQTELEVAKATGQDTTSLEKQIAALKKSLGLDKQKQMSLAKLTKEEQIFHKAVQDGATKIVAAEHAIAEGIGSAVAAYAMGQASIGQSLAKMVQQELASISQRASVKAIEELALGFSTMFTDPPQSGAHFTSAALFGSIGAATAVAGHAMSGAAGERSDRGSYNNPVNVTPTAGGVGTASPVQGVNVQSFALGGLITRPTLAVLGDNPSGKGEVAIPLGDEKAKQSIREAIGPGEGITVNVKGMISADNLKSVVKKMNRMVKKNQAPLVSSNAMRINRRSS